MFEKFEEGEIGARKDFLRKLFSPYETHFPSKEVVEHELEARKKGQFPANESATENTQRALFLICLLDPSQRDDSFYEKIIDLCSKTDQSVFKEVCSIWQREPKVVIDVIDEIF